MSKHMILPAALVMILAGAAGAEAAHRGWSFGGGFRVGGVHFRVGYADHGPHYGAPYFYTGGRFHYSGYRCGSYCFRGGGGSYHYASCPLVGHHFGRHGHDPYYLSHHYAPRHAPGYRYWVDYGGHYGDHGRGHHYGYRDHGYYGHRDYGYRDRGHHGYRGHGRYDYRRDYGRYDRGRAHDSRYDRRRDSRYDRRDYRYRDDADSDSDSDRRRGRYRR